MRQCRSRGPSHFSALALCTGEGAWINWKYQIRLSENTSVSNINETQYVLRNLRPSSAYEIQILAYSSSGRGPLSVLLRGKTLRETAFNISLLWASQMGLYSTDTLGENVQQLVSAQQFIPNVQGLMISSLAWHDHASVYFALTNGTIFHYVAENQTTNPKLTQIRSISYAHSIAFDYIGQKLYWSNPKRQAILRCSIGLCDESRENVELLQVVTIAREIAIDSENAFLLWSTGHSLEISRLNGYNHSVLYQTGLFSGVQIMGLTVDTGVLSGLDKSKVYFITRSSTGSKLWEMRYTENQQAPKIVANFNEVSITGPIRYFNDRLMWLQGSAEVVLMDVNTRTRSSLNVDTLSNITNIHVRDQNLQKYPRGLTKENIQVVPNSVPNWSIEIIGGGENFSIVWQPVSNINIGKVYYEVFVNNTFLKITEYGNISLPTSRFPPYSEIELVITSVTFWASSKPTVVRLYTPSSKPSEPKNPRIYVEKLSQIYQHTLLKEHVAVNESNPKKFHRDSYYIKAELRWDSPSYPNGKILGYVIDCWKNSVKTGTCTGNSRELSWQIQNLEPNSTYEFAIQAYTKAGFGNSSNKITTNFQLENPVPMLLLATSDRLEIFDIDRNSVQPIHLGVRSIPAIVSTRQYEIRSQNIIHHSPP
ncbi:unnamed protein product [Allacma fusca]|uniref:Fibronectin type-III domain-containing protein n=1 Tax=Allacma fusca TaxID=39272 RepID=A0A8J2KUH6_9HEXA|nr:unnamed protein product [Allacma fusca]